MHIRKQSEEINKKKIDSIYVIRYTALAQACLKAKCWRVDDKVQTGFLINFERAVVCSAFCERSYEGIGVCGRLGGKPRQMFEGTTKNAYTQEKREIICER